MRLTEIDELLRLDHWCLDEDDQCFFLYEYTSRRGWSYSEGNSIVSNLKKKVSLRGTPQYYWKEQTITRCGKELAASIRPDILNTTTFVPVPPSCGRDDPEFDERMTLVARAMGPKVDVRELVVQTESTPLSRRSCRRSHRASAPA